MTGYSGSRAASARKPDRSVSGVRRWKFGVLSFVVYPEHALQARASSLSGKLFPCLPSFSGLVRLWRINRRQGFRLFTLSPPQAGKL